MRDRAASVGMPERASTGDAIVARVGAAGAAGAVRQGTASPGLPLPTEVRHGQGPAIASAIGTPVAASSAGTQPGDAAERQADAVAADTTRDLVRGAASTPPPLQGASAATIDFSRVRLHVDAQASDAAGRLGARAFTYGDHIVFGDGRFAPHTGEGRQLIAHELVHVAQQQASGQAAVARDPLETYRTDPVTIKRDSIEALNDVRYWDQTVMGTFSLTGVNAALSRTGEERDALLSILWKQKPALPLTTAVEQIVAIPARKDVKGSKPVVFRCTFAPPAKKGDPPSLTIALLAEGDGARVEATATPPAGYAPASRSAGGTDFPGGMSTYWGKYPDERKQIDYWVDQAPKTFSRTLTTRSDVAGKPHRSAIQVSGEKDDKGKVTSLEMIWLSEAEVSAGDPPADYAEKDAGDLGLDKDRALKTGALGAIRGLDKVPKDEMVSVKHAVHQYFGPGSAKAEVDIVLPIANTTKNVHYTLRFLNPGNDVEVVRLGEQGAQGAYALDDRALNIGRANGYAAASGNETSLKAWLGKRYPAIKTTANNVAGIIVEANKTLEAEAGKVDWYAKNYRIDVLGASAGETRLLSAHAAQVAKAQTAGMKDFGADELHRIEFAMMPMSDAVVGHLGGVKMLRQTASLKITGSGKKAVATPDPKVAGLTWQNGGERTIGIFDNAFGNDAYLFAGGSRGIRPASTMTFSHELGHALESQAGIEAAFKAFVAKNKIKPMTWYAASKPTAETFPEAFALYQNDPEWMETNLPDLFSWFETLSRTGSPP
jgi:hypothetical protein